MIALKVFDSSFTQILRGAYELDSIEIVFITILSLLIVFLLEPSYRKFNSSVNVTESDSFTIRKYSFFTRFLIIFFILILIVTPIFKLLNTSYFI